LFVCDYSFHFTTISPAKKFWSKALLDGLFHLPIVCPIFPAEPAFLLPTRLGFPRYAACSELEMHTEQALSILSREQ